MVDIYSGRDPRLIPTYSIEDVASYLAIPKPTVRSWFCGRSYPTSAGRRCSRPVIMPDQTQPTMLSFLNLVEAYVFGSLRRKHDISTDRIRAALAWVERELKVPRPLAHETFQTDGVDLFVERLGKLLNASEEGQLAMKEVMRAHLQRVVWDGEGRALRLYPLSRSSAPGCPMLIVIDPRISFGQPVIAAAGVPTSILGSRFDAGESVEELAEDYGCDKGAIEEVLRYRRLRTA